MNKDIKQISPNINTDKEILIEIKRYLTMNEDSNINIKDLLININKIEVKCNDLSKPYLIIKGE